MSLEKEFNHITISATIILVSLIAGITIYSINDRNLMSKTLDSAISKGVDPLAVRCSYADSRDMVCVAYGASHGTSVVSKK
jgi:hypothetical protein